jgi:hypothetical protein
VVVTTVLNEGSSVASPAKVGVLDGIGFGSELVAGGVGVGVWQLVPSPKHTSHSSITESNLALATPASTQSASKTWKASQAGAPAQWSKRQFS